MRSAPARWYFADTPAAHRAQGPVRGPVTTLAVTRCGASPITPAAHRAQGPVRWAGNERFAVTRCGASPITPAAHRAQGPVRWAGNERFAVTRCGASPITPAAHRAQGPVRWAGNERFAVTRCGASPIAPAAHRAVGPDSLAGNDRLSVTRGRRPQQACGCARLGAWPVLIWISGPATSPRCSTSVAGRYDLLNDVLSARPGPALAARSSRAPSAAQAGERSSTSRPAPAPRRQPSRVSGADCVAVRLLLGMLRAGLRRVRATPARASGPQPAFVAGDALRLPFADDAFDAVTISFGLRNVVDPDARAAPRCSGSPGPAAALVICEFTRLPARPLRPRLPAVPGRRPARGRPPRGAAIAGGVRLPAPSRSAGWPGPGGAAAGCRRGWMVRPCEVAQPRRSASSPCTSRAAPAELRLAG